MLEIFRNIFVKNRRNSLKKDNHIDSELEQFVTKRINSKNKFSNTLDHENELLKNLAGLRGVKASDVMVPRIDIVSVSLSDNFDDIVKQLVKANHSRIPVIGESVDEIAGILHIKDVLAKMHSKEIPDIKTFLKEPIFVAPSISLLDLLHEMRIKKRHMALVVDEYGGIDGLVTIEDLVEEIVGEIEDEHDESTEIRFEKVSNNVVIVEAKVSLDYFKTKLKINFHELINEELDTLGGFIISLAGRVPVVGEVIRDSASGLEFEILDADPRKILLVKIRGLAKINVQ
ncbi:MAG: magnesium/cobalt efflux protein [SAR116 cluster bacterium]|jgi:magnesium and cobalt transporter|nr:magnesium/cobalt efflux protein [SAR116 cluster bacterium]